MGLMDIYRNSLYGEGWQARSKQEYEDRERVHRAQDAQLRMSEETARRSNVDQQHQNMSRLLELATGLYEADPNAVVPDPQERLPEGVMPEQVLSLAESHAKDRRTLKERAAADQRLQEQGAARAAEAEKRAVINDQRRGEAHRRRMSMPIPAAVDPQAKIARWAIDRAQAELTKGLDRDQDIDIWPDNAEILAHAQKLMENQAAWAGGGAGGAGDAGAAAAAVAPQVGDIKKFKSGKVGRWDGKGWVQVQ